MGQKYCECELCQTVTKNKPTTYKKAVMAYLEYAINNMDERDDDDRYRNQWDIYSRGVENWIRGVMGCKWGWNTSSIRKTLVQLDGTETEGFRLTVIHGDEMCRLERLSHLEKEKASIRRGNEAIKDLQGLGYDIKRHPWFGNIFMDEETAVALVQALRRRSRV